jgi:S1-C subfamily serine protease
MNKKATILWRLVVLALFAATVPLGAYMIEKNGTVDTDRMLDVSVSIRSMSHVTVDKYGDSVWETSAGSGFMVSSHNCEVWTNHHVIAEAALVEVYPRGWNGTSGIPATIVNSTPRSDIAILKLERCDGIPQARLGDSDQLQPGDETFAVGNPLGRNPDSISRGIISHTLRYRAGSTPYLQTDAAINPGNSGGALFNSDGFVIGINTAIETSRNGANVGVGFAVPINLARRVVADLHQGHPSWGDAGLSDIVSNLTVDEAEVLNVPGGNAALVVTQTPEEGPSAGKLLQHDVIYQINDTGIVNRAQAVRMIDQYDVGETLTLGLIREGNSETVDIVLGEGWKADQAHVADEYEGYLGMTLEMWTAEEGVKGSFTNPVITKVHSLGPAHKAHISSSQNSLYVNGQYVIPYLIDVKTVTGIAYEGKFHSINSVDEIEQFAARAYQDELPLLLEIELWSRPNPRNLAASLELAGTEFFKLMPKRADDENGLPEPVKVSTPFRPTIPIVKTHNRSGADKSGHPRAALCCTPGDRFL